MRYLFATALGFVLSISAYSSDFRTQIGSDVDLAKPVAPGEAAPWRATSQQVIDPPETGSLYQKPVGPTVADWYINQHSPFVVVYIDRRLERLPPDWNGEARLMIAESSNVAGKIETKNTTIGVEHKTAINSIRNRTSLIKLLEGALVGELKQARFKLIDPTVAERAMTSRSNGGVDTEYLSLKGSAGFILEVELVPGGRNLVMVGGLKNINTGEIVATVRHEVQQDISEGGAAVLAKAFVKALLATPVAD